MKCISAEEGFVSIAYERKYAEWRFFDLSAVSSVAGTNLNVGGGVESGAKHGKKFFEMPLHFSWLHKYNWLFW